MKMRKNAKGRGQELNAIRIRATELGLKFDDRSGEFTTETGKEAKKKSTVTAATQAEGFDLGTYSQLTLDRVELGLQSPEGINSMYSLKIPGPDGRALSRKQIEAAAKSVKKGKPNTAAKIIYDYIEAMEEFVDIEDTGSGRRAQVSTEEFFAMMKPAEKANEPDSTESAVDDFWDITGGSWGARKSSYTPGATMQPLSLAMLRELATFTPPGNRNDRTPEDVYKELTSAGISYLAEGHNPFRKCQ
jgi:hypothetical protein